MANPNPVGRRRSGVPNRVNTAGVQRALAEGKRLPPEEEPFAWNGLPVNTAAGLEAGLIRLIRPEWNMLGAGG